MRIRSIQHVLRLGSAIPFALFNDLARGTLIMALMFYFGWIPLPEMWLGIFAALAWGSFWALFPDICDGYWFLMSLFSDEKNDHHDNWTHRPLHVFAIVSPLLLLFFFSTQVGMFAVAAYIALATHFIHDKHPFGDGYINLLWPLPPKKHERSPLLVVWLKTRWLKPTRRSVGEIIEGLFELSIALWLVSYWYLAPLVALVVIVGAIALWSSNTARR